MPTKLSILAEGRDGIEILSVAGEVDMSTAPRLAQAIDRAISPEGSLIADLSEVAFIDSAGARALVLAEAAAADRGAALLIVPSEAVARVLEVAGLESGFRLCAGLSEAVAAARGVTGAAGRSVAG
ncbi:MAG TPA: STAS domain-containing protein [Actinospica sp.]|jgi:anti-anti-sigma factor|nr:STAS domain-containing protein [Actinospica sp.]